MRDCSSEHAWIQRSIMLADARPLERLADPVFAAGYRIEQRPDGRYQIDFPGRARGRLVVIDLPLGGGDFGAGSGNHFFGPPRMPARMRTGPAPPQGRPPPEQERAWRREDLSAGILAGESWPNRVQQLEALGLAEVTTSVGFEVLVSEAAGRVRPLHRLIALNARIDRNDVGKHLGILRSSAADLFPSLRDDRRLALDAELVGDDIWEDGIDQLIARFGTGSRFLVGRELLAARLRRRPPPNNAELCRLTHLCQKTVSACRRELIEADFDFLPASAIVSPDGRPAAG
jgi:hypothetical protein